MTPYQLQEARRLHAAGIRLCELYPMSKRPVGDHWNAGGVAAIREGAGGYGMLLADNEMCSVDVDSEALCEVGLRRCGFDLEDIRGLGVHTSSTRPDSGGRVAFKVPALANLRWVKFSSKTRGTILELRATSPNLQDTLPGTVYMSQDGTGPWVQDYAGIWTLDTAPELPDRLAEWWERLSTDVDFLRVQQALFVGPEVQLAVSSGDGKLAYASPHRIAYNDDHSVVGILERHGYVAHRNGRYAPSTATGAPAVRQIPGRDDLWQSDHASDPLHGTFDAWTAHVVLDHHGDLSAAEGVAETQRQITAVDGFEDCPVTMWTSDTAAVGHVASKPEPEALPSFERMKDGKIKPTVNNLIDALVREDIVGGRIGYDAFRDEVMIVGNDDTQWRPFRDPDYVWLRARLEKGMNGFAPISKDLMRDLVSAIADKHHFDSAVDWLNSLKYDGAKRVDTFFIDYFRVADTAYNRAVSRYLWSALAGRVLSPGCQADMTPILVGAQGKRKSSAISAMVPRKDLMVEVSFTEHETDLARKMRGKLIAEISELRGLNTKDQESIKAFITRRDEQWVPKYKEFSTTYPRRLIFVATTNEDQILADKTGHRRWLPVQLGPGEGAASNIDIEGIAAVCEQLWAEARGIYQSQGIQWQDAERLAKPVHDEFLIDDSWVGIVRQWLKDRDLFSDGTESMSENLTNAEVLAGAIRLEPKNIDRKAEMRMGGVLVSMGYVRKRVRVGKDLQWMYVPTKK